MIMSLGLSANIRRRSNISRNKESVSSRLSRSSASYIVLLLARRKYYVFVDLCTNTEKAVDLDFIFVLEERFFFLYLYLYLDDDRSFLILGGHLPYDSYQLLRFNW